MNEKTYDIFTSFPDVVTVYQLKEMLGIGITLAYSLVKNGVIKSVRIGKEYKIPKSNVINYLMVEKQ